MERLKDGEKISLSDSELICFHTPGHTAGSMCYELVGKGEKVLFTGDFMQAGEEDGSASGIQDLDIPIKNISPQ